MCFHASKVYQLYKARLIFQRKSEVCSVVYITHHQGSLNYFTSLQSNYTKWNALIFENKKAVCVCTDHLGLHICCPALPSSWGSAGGAFPP